MDHAPSHILHDRGFRCCYRDLHGMDLGSAHPTRRLRYTDTGRGHGKNRSELCRPRHCHFGRGCRRIRDRSQRGRIRPTGRWHCGRSRSTAGVGRSDTRSRPQRPGARRNAVVPHQLRSDRARSRDHVCARWVHRAAQTHSSAIPRNRDGRRRSSGDGSAIGNQHQDQAAAFDLHR